MKKATKRVSARTTNIEFGEKYGTKYCIPTWLRDEQIRIATRKVKGRIKPSNDIRNEPIAVVGYGPSLQQTWEQVRGFKYIISCSGAHKFLLERGILPTWHVEVDPREHKVELLGPAHKHVTYLPSSTSHPRYLDHILASGANVELWHVFTHDIDGHRILPPGEWAITGGADAGLRALVMARLFGFVDIHVFGLDGSAGAGEQSHAANHPNPPGKFFDCEYPKGSGKFFKTTPALMSCAKSVPHEVDQLKDAKVTFYGEGLIQTIMSHHQPKKPKESAIAFVKPDLISEDYRALNEQLHMDNPMYGTSGAKYVEAVLQLVKATSATSILDYGCGKGLLAKGLPFPIWEYDPAVEGKRESPRPADLVVCTDVLEHIEPANLTAVLADLARVTRKVGYFAIHTGPARKVLADGRNAHLIQQPLAWWKNELSQFFEIAKIFDKGVEVIAVVGPRKEPVKLVANAANQITSAQHQGTEVKFHTPNTQTEWRAKTLFTKEPATIAWIETFQKNEMLYDVGANVGGYTVWASKRRGVQVVAFEPEARNYALLNRNMTLNGVDGVAYCMAVSDDVQVTAIHLSKLEEGGSCHSLGASVGPDLKPRNSAGVQGCLSMPLDMLVQQGKLPQPDHIKIDVDGFEHRVIAGAREILKGVKSLLVEVNTNLPEHQQMVRELVAMGFRFDQAQVDASTRKEGAFKGCAEYVFTRY